MFDRLSRSWNLLKASAGVLRQDKQLVVFPLVSAAAMLVVFASFAVPVVGLGLLDSVSGGRNQGVSVATYVVAFLFYFAHYLVIFFFNTALVGAAMIRLDEAIPPGRRPAHRFSRLGAMSAGAHRRHRRHDPARDRGTRGFVGKIIVGLLGIG
jgi:hypothetical protein